MTNVNSVDSLISEFRHGHLVLLVLDQGGGKQTGVVALAAVYCEASLVTFLARQEHVMVSLALTESLC